jgi:hypothetical protein
MGENTECVKAGYFHQNLAAGKVVAGAKKT